MANSNPLPARRGSLVTPLLVVGLGVLLLVSNLRPELPLWKMLTRYWPFLIIFWGSARLIEYIVARLFSRPIGRTLGGGELFLIILLCLFGSGAMVASRWYDQGGWSLPRRGLDVFGESFDFPMQASQEVAPNASLVISNLQGNVRVVGAESSRLTITGRKSIRAYLRTGAEQADKDTPLQITSKDGQVVVRTNQDRLPSDIRISTDLEIAVPKTMAVSLEGRYGDFEVMGVAGPVDVNSNNAGVRLSNISKDVHIRLRRSDIIRATQLKGNIEISGRGQDIELDQVAGTVTIQGEFSGNIKFRELARPVRYTSSQTELQFEKLPGRLELDHGSLTAAEIIGPFKLTTRSKQVRLEDFSKEVEISSQRGDIELRTAKLPLSNISVESRIGDIALAVPGNAAFQLQASTSRGRALSEFEKAVKVEGRGATGAEMRSQGSSGPASGAQIRLSTNRGDITLKKIG